MFAEVADALEAAHQVGVIHRDVKPSNLILADDGRLKLIDFGLAWMRGEESLVTASGERLGTPLYMSPELARGEKVDARSDVYSLGTTLYEVLALRPPHRGERPHEIVHRILTREPPPLRRVNPRVPRDLETIVHRALEKEPAQRYATAAAFGRDLRACAAGEGIRARPVGPVGRLWRRAKRHPVASSLIVAVLVLLALGAGLWIKASRYEARERALAYRMLCAQAEIALARTSEEPARSELRLAPPSSARKLFDAAIARDPERPEAWMGRALTSGSTLEQSLADLEDARKRGLGARSYHLARASFLDSAGKKEEAREERRLAASAPEGGALAAFLEGRFLMASGKPLEALPHLDVAIRAAPEESLHRYLALMVRSVARRRTGNFEGALEDLHVLSALSGDSRAIRVRSASVWRQLGREERAEELFRAELEEVAAAGLGREWLHLLDGLSPRSDQDWLDLATARALEAHPDSLELMLRRLDLLRDCGANPVTMELSQRILERDPDCVRALEELAFSLLGAGQAEKALSTIDKAIALAPTEPALHNTRGMALSALRRFEEAEVAYREVVRLDPGAALGWSNLAGVLSLQKRQKEALEVAERARELAPEHANTHGIIGGALHDLGRFEESVVAYERALELGACSPFDYGHYGIALSDAGRVPEGLAWMDKALALAAQMQRGERPMGSELSMLAADKSLLGIRTGRSSALIRLGRYEEALAEARICAEIAPEEAIPWEHMAQALFMLARYGASRDAAERATAASPLAHNPRCLLGSALWKLGQLAAARKVLEESIPLDPTCTATYSRLAEVCSESGDLEAAVRYYRLAIEHGSAIPRGAAVSWINLGATLVPLRRRVEALEAFDTALKLDPTQDWVHLNRGTVLGLLGRHAEAVAAFEAGMKGDPQRIDGGGGRANLRHNYAWNLFMTGRIENALKQQLQVIATAPGEAAVHMRHALYLAWLDRFDEAQKAFERGLAAGPSSEEARRPAIEFLLLAGKPQHAAALGRRAFASDRLRCAVPYLRALRAPGRHRRHRRPRRRPHRRGGRFGARLPRTRLALRRGPRTRPRPRRPRPRRPPRASLRRLRAGPNPRPPRRIGRRPPVAGEGQGPRLPLALAGRAGPGFLGAERGPSLQELHGIRDPHRAVMVRVALRRAPGKHSPVSKSRLRPILNAAVSGFAGGASGSLDHSVGDVVAVRFHLEEEGSNSLYETGALGVDQEPRCATDLQAIGGSGDAAGAAVVEEQKSSLALHGESDGVGFAGPEGFTEERIYRVGEGDLGEPSRGLEHVGGEG